jgi:hypothetical protein
MKLAKSCTQFGQQCELHIQFLRTHNEGYSVISSMMQVKIILQFEKIDSLIMV